MIENLQAHLVDTHAHLDSGRFQTDLDQVVQRAAEHGIRHVISVGCDLDSSRACIDIALQYPGIYASVGIHPHDASTADHLAMDELGRMAEAVEKVVAIGETGLDFYRNRSPHDLQRAAFKNHIRLAKTLGKPLIVHDRDAHDEVVAILKEERAGQVGGVLHCFSGDLAMAKTCVDLGFLISFAGPLTYPKNEELRQVAASLPCEALLLETDCPYLAPQSRRGKRCEPADVRQTAECLAQIKSLSVEDVARITTLNAFRLFGIGQVDQKGRIAYVIRNSLYLNITNRCTNHCTFCAKFRDFTVKGHQLCLQHEPSSDEVIAAIGDPSPYDEVVFCGYGEPLIRLDVVKQVALWLKKRNIKVRINTDGQANLVHGRNILPELQGLVDAISVSLNAPDAEQYQVICQSDFGKAAYGAIQQFLLEAKQYIPSVTATAVTLPGVDMVACRKIADELGVAFRERTYNDLG